MKPLRIVAILGLNMYFLVLGRAFIIAIVFGVAFTILGRLPLAGLFILIVQCFSSTSIHWILEASQLLAPVSFNTCRNVAVFLPQPAINWSISVSVGMNGSFCCTLVFGGSHERLNVLTKLLYTTIKTRLFGSVQLLKAKTVETLSGSVRFAPFLTSVFSL